MKSSKYLYSLFFLIFSAVLFYSCKTMQTPTEINEETPVFQSEQILQGETEKILEKEFSEESLSEISDPAVELKSEPKKIDEEYKRSTSELLDQTITQDDFLTDKKEILEKIDELAKIMLAKDYGKWLYYLSPQSKEYWQDQTNLNVVSSRLPVKGYTLKNLEDYFRMIFVPSRQNSKVDEIRYVSPTFVKAVQVRGEQDIVYYYFIKINNTWLLELDTL